MSIEIRSIRDDELLPWVDALTIGFLDRPDAAAIVAEVRPHWDLARAWAAFDGDQIVGTARTWATELTVPGNRQVKASALAAVTVRPTHRRRGILRKMLAAEHAAAREREEIVGLLYASDYPIYSRFGYGSAVQTAMWVVDVASTGFHEAAGGTTGSFELLPADEATLEVIRGVFEAHRLVQPGEIWRRPITWRGDLGLSGAAWGEVWKGFVVVHRDATGAVDGYARYRAEAKWEHRQPRGTVTVDDLHALNGEAEVALWRFLAAIDLVTTVKAERRAPSDRVRWLLTNGRAAEMADAGDGMWLRVHDIPAALEARTYERTGSLVLEVVIRGAGADGTDERIRIALDAGPGGSRAIATDRTPELTIDAAALGAAYLGGTRLRDAALARGWDEHRDGALAEADALFATLDEPWCSTFF